MLHLPLMVHACESNVAFSVCELKEVCHILVGSLALVVIQFMLFVIHQGKEQMFAVLYYTLVSASMSVGY